MNTPTRRERRAGFTLVELLIVIVVIGLLAALLLPAIGSAIRAAKNATVTSEMNQMGQALASFKTKFGDYPPSKILLLENGNYTSYMTATTSYTLATASSVDISDAQLAQRSLSAMRKFFPRLQLYANGSSYPNTSTNNIPNFPDFNGNGTQDGPIVLTGDECLVFFLGGMPSVQSVSGKNVFSMTGISRNPANPYLSAAVSASNRLVPFFEFRSNRLLDFDNDGYPSYVDSLGTDRPYAYFSSYGGTGYDANDVNYDTGSSLVEGDNSGTVSPITLKFRVTFPVSGGPPNIATSPPPNPYTSTTTGATPVVYHNPQSFQIISAGGDGQYGVGGYYSQQAGDPLPVDTANTNPTGDPTLRAREKDNLTNFTVNKLD
jgi:prepilin-type N-terminal cleavage/methylation domain-containing protein